MGHWDSQEKQTNNDSALVHSFPVGANGLTRRKDCKSKNMQVTSDTSLQYSIKRCHKYYEAIKGLRYYSIPKFHYFEGFFIANACKK